MNKRSILNDREWIIAVTYTIMTAIECFLIMCMLSSDSDTAIFYMLLIIPLGTLIIASLFSYDSKYDDIQEY